MKRKTFLQTLAALVMGGPLVASGRIEMPTRKIQTAKPQCNHEWYQSTGPQRCWKCGEIHRGEMRK